MEYGASGHVCEVGVGDSSFTHLRDFIAGRWRVTMVEPHPDHVADLVTMFGRSVTVWPCAIMGDVGTVTLFEQGGWSWVHGVQSPALALGRDMPVGMTDVRSLPFSVIDDGTIDALTIDAEGAELFVIADMVSRPKVIEIEWAVGEHEHPFAAEILKILVERGYRNIVAKEFARFVHNYERQFPCL